MYMALRGAETTEVNGSRVCVSGRRRHTGTRSVSDARRVPPETVGEDTVGLPVPSRTPFTSVDHGGTTA